MVPHVCLSKIQRVRQPLWVKCCCGLELISSEDFRSPAVFALMPFLYWGAEFGCTWQYMAVKGACLVFIHPLVQQVTLLPCKQGFYAVTSIGIHASHKIYGESTGISLLCLHKSCYFSQPRWVNHKILIHWLFTPQLWVICTIFTGKTMHNSSSSVNNSDCLSAAKWRPSHRSVSCSMSPHPSEILLLKWV